MFSIFVPGCTKRDPIINTDDEEQVAQDLSDFFFELKENENNAMKVVLTSSDVFDQILVDPMNTLYIAIGIEKAYNEDEIEAIKEFIKAGGHAIIAADFGHVQALAEEFNITYYTGQFYDEHFDKNTNFPICEAILGVDRGQWQYKCAPGDIPNNAGQFKIFLDEPDGVYDDNDDGDPWVDEDNLDRLDNDQDNQRLERDNKDNNYDGLVDEFGEGVDEDTWDDDGDWIDENGNHIQDPYEMGVNEERLNGLNDDASIYVFTLEPTSDYLEDLGRNNISEHLRAQFESYNVPLSNYTTISGSNGEWEINDSNWKFYVRQNHNELLVYKVDEMVDEDIFHYNLIMNQPVGLDSFKTKVNVIARGSENSYLDLDNNGVIELPKEGSATLSDRVSTASNRVELIVEVIDERFVGTGSIVFITDENIFTNDLCSLDHMSINYESVNHNLYFENNLNITQQDIDDLNDMADNTPDNHTDYDNTIFLQDLISYLFYDKLASNDGADISILIDDRRIVNNDSGDMKFNDAPEEEGIRFQDIDSDGLPDIKENYLYGTNITNPDTDGDGMLDGWEVTYMVKDIVSGKYMIDPNFPDANEDPDGDGWINLQEYENGTSPIDSESYPLLSE